jgi:hypothetical protein
MSYSPDTSQQRKHCRWNLSREDDQKGLCSIQIKVAHIRAGLIDNYYGAIRLNKA